MLQVKFADHVDSEFTRPLKLRLEILCKSAREVPLDRAPQADEVIGKLKNVVEDALKEYGRTPETKLGAFSAQVLARGLLSPVGGVLQSISDCVGAYAASVVLDSTESWEAALRDAEEEHREADTLQRLPSALVTQLGKFSRSACFGLQRLVEEEAKRMRTEGNLRALVTTHQRERGYDARPYNRGNALPRDCDWQVQLALVFANNCD